MGSGRARVRREGGRWSQHGQSSTVTFIFIEGGKGEGSVDEDRVAPQREPDRQQAPARVSKRQQWGKTRGNGRTPGYAKQTKGESKKVEALLPGTRHHRTTDRQSRLSQIQRPRALAIFTIVAVFAGFWIYPFKLAR